MSRLLCVDELSRAGCSISAKIDPSLPARSPGELPPTPFGYPTVTRLDCIPDPILLYQCPVGSRSRSRSRSRSSPPRHHHGRPEERERERHHEERGREREKERERSHEERGRRRGESHEERGRERHGERERGGRHEGDGGGGDKDRHHDGKEGGKRYGLITAHGHGGSASNGGGEWKALRSWGGVVSLRLMQDGEGVSVWLG